MEFPSSAAGQARQPFLTHTIVWFLKTLSGSEYSFMTKYHQYYNFTSKSDS